jgi:hypothetical protein
LEAQTIQWAEDSISEAQTIQWVVWTWGDLEQDSTSEGQAVDLTSEDRDQDLTSEGQVVDLTSEDRDQDLTSEGQAVDLTSEDQGQAVDLTSEDQGQAVEMECLLTCRLRNNQPQAMVWLPLGQAAQRQRPVPRCPVVLWQIASRGNLRTTTTSI